MQASRVLPFDATDARTERAWRRLAVARWIPPAGLRWLRHVRMGLGRELLCMLMSADCMSGDALNTAE